MLISLHLVLKISPFVYNWTGYTMIDSSVPRIICCMFRKVTETPVWSMCCKALQLLFSYKM